jgi:hypothetical protein
MRHLNYLVFLPLLLVVTGCGPRFVVKVDSINAGYESQKKNYILLPSNEGVDVNDLQFQEYSQYVKHALSRQGFIEATDFNSAEVAIFLRYGIGDPQATPFSFSLPVYGQTGGGMSTFSASTYGSGGYANTYGTISSMPTYGVVGSQTYSGTRTSYFRYMIIDCIDLEVYRRDKTMKQLWKTTVTSSGSSGDLRQVFPILVTASDQYIGTNTGKQVRLDLYENDSRVKQIKGLE